MPVIFMTPILSLKMTDPRITGITTDIFPETAVTATPAFSAEKQKC
jgi:hypothetical protein